MPWTGSDGSERRRLRLRASSHVYLGLLAGPALGLSVMWAVVVAAEFLGGGVDHPASSLAQLVVGLPLFLIPSELVCLVVEAVLVAPLLVGFHRYRWRWLNGWTGPLFGFVIGAAPTLLVVQPWGGGLDRLLPCAATGLVGFVAAIFFRLVAVEVEPDDVAGVF